MDKQLTENELGKVSGGADICMWCFFKPNGNIRQKHNSNKYEMQCTSKCMGAIACSCKDKPWCINGWHLIQSGNRLCPQDHANHIHKKPENKYNT